MKYISSLDILRENIQKEANKLGVNSVSYSTVLWHELKHFSVFDNSAYNENNLHVLNNLLYTFTKVLPYLNNPEVFKNVLIEGKCVQIISITASILSQLEIGQDKINVLLDLCERYADEMVPKEQKFSAYYNWKKMFITDLIKDNVSNQQNNIEQIEAKKEAFNEALSPSVGIEERSELEPPYLVEPIGQDSNPSLPLAGEYANTDWFSDCSIL